MNRAVRYHTSIVCANHDDRGADVEPVEMAHPDEDYETMDNKSLFILDSLTNNEDFHEALWDNLSEKPLDPNDWEMGNL